MISFRSESCLPSRVWPLVFAMYQPPLFRENDRDAIIALMRGQPLGLLVTAGPGGLMANAIPFLYDDQGGPFGMLRCHVAKANGQWKELGEGLDALIIFQGPDHYIRPGWYETKRETHKVVPTWNYAMVQARGVARAIEDQAWLAHQIRAVTQMMEGGAPEPWSVEDAPDDFIASQIKGIVGIEIALTSLEGKWKVSQNRNQADREGVVEGLSALDDPNAAIMASMVAARLKSGA
jgi:transcriptional regulator